METNWNHTLEITGDQTEYFGSETFGFATSELAASTGYEYVKDFPNVRIVRRAHGRIVSTYSPNMGWL